MKSWLMSHSHSHSSQKVERCSEIAVPAIYMFRLRGSKVKNDTVSESKKHSKVLKEVEKLTVEKLLSSKSQKVRHLLNFWTD